MLILTFYEANAAARGTKNKDGEMKGSPPKANKSPCTIQV